RTQRFADPCSTRPVLDRLPNLVQRGRRISRPQLAGDSSKPSCEYKSFDAVQAVLDRVEELQQSAAVAGHGARNIADQDKRARTRAEARVGEVEYFTAVAQVRPNRSA